MSTKLYCYSPMDAWVSEVLERPRFVSEDEVIVRLKSPELDRRISIVDVLESQLRLSGKPLRDGRVDELVSRIPKDVDVLQKVTAAAGQFDSTIVPALRPRALLQTATLKHGLAHMTVLQKHVANRVRDARDQLEVALAAIQHERVILQDLLACLTIRAPKSGTATFNLFPGQFVEKGQVCGVLEL